MAVSNPTGPPLNKPMGQAEMYNLAAQYWQGSNIDIAVAISKAESSWIVNNWHKNGDGSIDRGLWQINDKWHPEFNDFNRLLTDPDYNAAAAFQISGHGVDWTPWATYNDGSYRKYLTGQQTAATSGIFGPQVATAIDAINNGSGAWTVTTLFDSKGKGPVQQPFDPRSNYASGPYRSSATKGQIIGQTDPAVGYVVKFLYNPQTISFGYSVDTAIKDPLQQDLSQMKVGLPQGTSTSISFQLYFDRTYEVIGGSKLGVLLDVQCFEWLVGITPAFPYMLPNRVKIQFGDPLDMTWNAYLTNFDVQYTHFNSAMVPFRCIIDVKGLRMGADQFLGKDDPLAKPVTSSSSSTTTKGPSQMSSPTGGPPSSIDVLSAMNKPQ